VRAAVDISDGLAADLAHLCEASEVGALLEADRFPNDPALEAAARALRLDPRALRIGASDDYELLLAVEREGLAPSEELAREAGVPWSVIGQFTESAGVLEWNGRGGQRAPLERGGFDHFA